MAARTGAQFLDGLRSRSRWVSLEGQLVDDPTTHPQLEGAARTLAGVFDRQYEFAAECLIPDPETGEQINISHMLPMSIDDLRRRVRGLSRISEATVGLMGRTPDYMNVKFASFAARQQDWRAGGVNDEGADNLVPLTRGGLRRACPEHLVSRLAVYGLFVMARKDRPTDDLSAFLSSERRQLTLRWVNQRAIDHTGLPLVV